MEEGRCQDAIFFVRKPLLPAHTENNQNLWDFILQKSHLVDNFQGITPNSYYSGLAMSYSVEQKAKE